jgi:hypothetical protein
VNYDDSMKGITLRSFQQWKANWGNPNLSIWDYINNQGNPELAVAFSKLFWPDFVEVRGCVLLAEHFKPTDFENWRRHFKEDRRQIEAAINEVHIYDLFTNSPPEEVAFQVYEYLAQVLQKSWNCALRDAYPSRAFEFDYRTEPEEYGPTLAFWQKTQFT